MVHSSSPWLLGCALTLQVFLGCRQAERPAASAVPSRASHTRMLAALEQLRDTQRDENVLLGERDLRSAMSDLSLLPPGAPQLARASAHSAAGFHLLRLGRIEEAIEHLDVAYSLLPRAGAAPANPSGPDELVIFNLALGYLRLGETQNCIECCNGESCLLPIQGNGVHQLQTGSRNAIRYLEILLERNPDHLAARWLLNIACMTVGEYPHGVPPALLIPPEVFHSKEQFPRFTNVSQRAGLNTVNLAGGSVADDFDGDGLLDVLTSTWELGGQIRCFRNGGDGSFREVTAEAGLTGIYGGLNMVQADYDNDGDIDVLVLRGAWLEQAGRHPNSLLENDGQGRFTDVTFDVGLGEVRYPTQTASWADFDNDGDLDVYIGNEGFPCQLFENRDGRFVDIALRAGVQNHRLTKGVVWGDYDNDRLPDIYVSNLPGDNRLYHNNGDGTFTDVAPRLGVTKPQFSFPVWFWDFNNDGALDLHVSSYVPDVRLVAADYLGLPVECEMDCLYQGDGQGGFRDVAAEVQLTRVTVPMGANFGDVDHDGFLDFYLGTGYVAYDGLMPNLLFHNRRGESFVDVTTSAGVGHLQKGHGVSFADLDNDGDQDIFVQLGGFFPGDAAADALFENPGNGNHWISVKLVGRQSNRSAIGAQIRLAIEEDGRQRFVYKWVNSGGSFGANPLRQQLGIGRATSIGELKVFWPTTGRSQVFHDVAGDQLIEITEGEDSYRTLPVRRSAH